MEQGSERLKNALDEWRIREQRYKKMFGDSITDSKQLLKEKLAHFEVVELKYRASGNVDELKTLKLVREQRRDAERALYPNLFTRLLYKAVRAIVDNPNAVRYQTINETKINRLKEQLKEKGFGSSLTQLDKHIAEGHREISIPVTYYVNEKERMEFKLELNSDYGGGYNIGNITASLKNEDGVAPKGTISLTNNHLDDLNAHQAYNLLSGRSVQQGENWVQLDFNDKDAAGNFKTKVFPTGYGFDPEKSLLDLKINEKQNGVPISEVLEHLRNGDKQTVRIAGKNVDIEANAQKKSVGTNQKNVPQQSPAKGAKVMPLRPAEKTAGRKVKLT